MAETSIDALSIEISASATKADKAIDKLTQSLEKLETACSVTTALASVEAKLKSLGNVLDKSDFSKLKQLNGIKLSKTVSTNLDALTKSLRFLPQSAAARLAAVSSALSSLSSLNGVTISKTITSRLKELPEAIKAYENINMQGFTAQINQLNTALTPLVATISKFATAVNSLPKSLRTAAAASRTVVSTNKTLTTSTSAATNAIKSEVDWLAKLYARGLRAYMVLRQIGTALSSFINESNSYIENMNLFQASMGAGTEAATEFGMKAQQILGIDFGEWARNQGVFQTLITGMGVVSEKSNVMSQQLTQLGYDIASFYNISVEDAMLKLQSGIAGELEPLRRLGWDLSNARMNLELTKMGIEGNAQSMTQAEKVALRYYMIMNQVTITHGDMARTIASPANQLRVLQAQLTLTARTIGNLFIPVLNMILPTVIAIVKAIRLLAIELANFFGIDATFEVDYSNLDTSGIASATDDLGDGLDDANDKAKELKNTIMGFDEINKLNDISDASSKKGSSTGGLGLDLPVDTYDFFEGMTDEISKVTDEMAERIAATIKRLLPVIAAVGTALAAWKIGTGLINSLGTLKSNLRVLKGDTGKVADDFERASKTNFKNVDQAKVSFSFLPTFSGNMFKNLGGASAVMGKIAAAAAILGVHFVNLAINSESFQRGVGAIGDWVGYVLDNLPSIGTAIADFFAGVGEGITSFITGMFSDAWKTIKQIFSAWDIEIPDPDFSNLINFFGIIGEMLGDVGASVNEVFDLQWSDAMVVAAAGIALLIPGFGEVFAAVLLIGEAISLAIRAIGWATSPVVEEVDALAGVSEETAARFGTSLDSMADAMRILDTIDFADSVVSEDDVIGIETKVQDIKDTILNNLDAERNEELAAIDALKGLLPDEEIEELKRKTNEMFDERELAVQESTARINEIYKTASSENRTISDEEATEIRSIQSQLQDDLIASSGATKEEINKITSAMANNNEAVALESSSNILKAAIEERDGRVQAAWDEYDAAMLAADGLLAAGKISQEEYDNIKEAALNTAQAEMDAANEAYYGTDGVVNKVTNGLGDAKRQINTDTGEIKSNWDIFCEDTASAWDEFCAGLGEGVDNISSYWSHFFDESVPRAWEKWTQFCNWIGSGIIGAANTVIGGLNSIITGVEGMVNDAISALNSFRIDIPNEVPFVGGTKFSLNLPYVYLPRIPYFAEGGFPETGQLFFARENGAEMVGQMGNRTAVANNQQIVEGIEQGVMSAMLQVMSVTGGFDKREDDQPIELVIKVDGSELGRASYKSIKQLERRGEIRAAFGY